MWPFVIWKHCARMENTLPESVSSICKWRFRVITPVDVWFLIPTWGKKFFKFLLIFLAIYVAYMAESIYFLNQAKYWRQYLEAQMAVNNDEATKQIFSRCLLNCFQIPLWYVFAFALIDIPLSDEPHHFLYISCILGMHSLFDRLL